MMHFDLQWRAYPSAMHRGTGFCKCAFVILLFFIAVGNFRNAFAQRKLQPLFEDQNRVCFVGNSITQSGGYQHYIYLFHVTRFPWVRVTFFNCGVGGDTAPKILARMDEDIFVHDPDHLILMVGMNDVGRSLYAPQHSGDPDIEKMKERALKTYRDGTEEIVKRFKLHTPLVTLTRPSIYDETSKIDTENLIGVNDALRVCGDHLSALAHRYNTKIVDFWTILNALNLQAQHKDSLFTIIGNDRIHPRVTGHMVMAYQFLKTMGATPYVSSMVIRRDSARGNRESINCNIRRLIFSREQISFVALENSLPFPVPAGAREAFSMVPFTDALNQEILKVPGLRKGVYDLKIDGVLIGSYAEKDLETGINLANHENTPQYQQALMVMETCVRIRKLQGNLRLLKRVEYVELAASERELNLDSIASILDTRLHTRYLHDRYDFNKKLFTDYKAIKPRTHEIRDSIRALEDRVYQMNLPVDHRYEITKRN